MNVYSIALIGALAIGCASRSRTHTVDTSNALRSIGLSCALSDSSWDSDWLADGVTSRVRARAVRWYDDADENWQTGTARPGFGGGSRLGFDRPVPGRDALVMYGELDKEGGAIPLDSTGRALDTMRLDWRDIRTHSFVVKPSNTPSRAVLDSFAGTVRCDSVIGVAWVRGRRQPIHDSLRVARVR